MYVATGSPVLLVQLDLLPKEVRGASPQIKDVTLKVSLRLSMNVAYQIIMENGKGKIVDEFLFLIG